MLFRSDRIIDEPITFYLSAVDAVKASFELPSGLNIVITQATPYTTSNEEEIDFLSKQRFLGVKRLTDKEFRFFATKQFNKIPTVYNKDIKGPKDIEEYAWTSDSEQRIIAKLKENGYIVYKKKDSKEK